MLFVASLAFQKAPQTITFFFFFCFFFNFHFRNVAFDFVHTLLTLGRGKEVTCLGHFLMTGCDPRYPTELEFWKRPPPKKIHMWNLITTFAITLTSIFLPFSHFWRTVPAHFGWWTCHLYAFSTQVLLKLYYFNFTFCFFWEKWWILSYSLRCSSASGDCFHFHSGLFSLSLFGYSERLFRCCENYAAASCFSSGSKLDSFICLDDSVTLPFNCQLGQKF